MLRLLAAPLLAALPLASAGAVRYTEVLSGGELGISSFRIPGFVTTNGTMHVFAEGREHSCADRSPHSLVYTRSTDEGLTFSPPRRIVDPPAVWGAAEGGPAGGAVMDPTPVYDAATDTIWVLFSYDPAQYMRYAHAHGGHLPNLAQATELWAVHSTSGGLHWSLPRNLSDVNRVERGSSPATRWGQRTAGGGGNGIQVTTGPRQGRLIVPGYHLDDSLRIADNYTGPQEKYKHPYAHAFYSDNNGQTWHVTEDFFADTAEGSIVELFESPGDDGHPVLMYLARRADKTNCTNPRVDSEFIDCVGRAYSTDSGRPQDIVPTFALRSSEKLSDNRAAQASRGALAWMSGR